MNIFVVDNSYLFKDENGDYYAHSVYSYDFLKRYLNVFDEVKFIGKVRSIKKENTSNYNLVSGPGICIVELPWYQGGKQMLKKIPKILKSYWNAGKNVDCFAFRIAQMESFFTYYIGRRRKQPYIVEVVNDPETFTDINSFVRKVSVYMVKKLCKKANGASYVTERVLQSKYPNAAMKGVKGCFESYYSSVNLEENDIYLEPLYYEEGIKFQIVHVANAINGDVKGHYTLIKMAERLKSANINFKVICIGDGTMVPQYEAYVSELGLNDNIKFIGRVHSKDALLRILRESNLMVLPTKMEGLPRTIIEAMAVGLPCLSTPIAGIPELLKEKYLFDPMDDKGFADCVIELISNPQELHQMSVENLAMAKNFTRPVLEKRRTEFYSRLRSLVEKSRG